MKTITRTPDLLHKTDAAWRAKNHLSVRRIYPAYDPLRKRSLTVAHVEHVRKHGPDMPGIRHRMGKLPAARVDGRP